MSKQRAFIAADFVKSLTVWFVDWFYRIHLRTPNTMSFFLRPSFESSISLVDVASYVFLIVSPFFESLVVANFFGLLIVSNISFASSAAACFFIFFFLELDLVTGSTESTDSMPSSSAGVDDFRVQLGFKLYSVHWLDFLLFYRCGCRLPLFRSGLGFKLCRI